MVIALPPSSSTMRGEQRKLIYPDACAVFKGSTPSSPLIHRAAHVSRCLTFATWLLSVNYSRAEPEFELG